MVSNGNFLAYLFLSIYAAWIGLENKEFLAIEPNAARLGSLGIVERFDNCLLFGSGRLRKNS